jgi:hypothetical protein
MRTSTAIALFVLAPSLACGDKDGDDGGAEVTSVTIGMTSAATTGAESESGGMTTTTAATSSGEAGTGPADSSGSDDAPEGSSGGGNLCDPVVPGDWNACLDEMGNVDNTQCMWMGTGESVGFVGCLTSSMTEGANVCFIEGCRDACDCFAPPATGTAEPFCGEILEGGGVGCALDCSGGKTCPDGMECITDLCFWPPA